MLRRAEVDDVIRYWLAALRFEEALTNRPRARRPGPRGFRDIDLIKPQGEHQYFKLVEPNTFVEFLSLETPVLMQNVRGERGEFFMRWLRQIYRQQEAHWAVAEGPTQEVVVGWPTIFFPRGAKLASLLRFRATIEWLDAEGRPFTVPSRKQRKQGRLPAPPSNVRITALDQDEEDLLPYALDTQILTRLLGVAEEELAELYGTLRGAENLSAAEMIETVIALIENPHEGVSHICVPREDEHAEDRFQKLGSLMESKIGLGRGRPQVYPVGIVLDQGRLQTTHHLQRELSVIGEKRGIHFPGGQAGPLWSYLSRTVLSTGWAPVRGLFKPVSLTPTQRAVAETFSGSTLTAAQGPPGTGKTKLILDLCAAHLTEQVSTLADSGRMGDDVLVVTSTNNRAVDNVLSPLSDQVGIPLGLRTGSQMVTASLTAETLSEALEWFQDNARDELSKEKEALKVSLASFSETRERLEKLESGRVESRRRNAQMMSLENKIETLSETLDLENTWGHQGSPAILEECTSTLRALARRLDALSKLLERNPSDVFNRVLRQWRRTGGPARRSAIETLAKLRPPISLEFELPPPGPVQLDVEMLKDSWEEALEDAKAEVDGLLGSISKELAVYAKRSELENLRTAQKVAREEWAQQREGFSQPDALAPAALHFELFQTALMVRKQWAKVHYLPLTSALSAALDAALERRSLRRMLDDDDEHGPWLKRLFPIFGSTLLSLGNVFPTQSNCFEKLVIDEGGQCHPAYAVSGLLRAERALVIGDVFQLQPVMALSEDDDDRVRRAARIKLSPELVASYSVSGERARSAQSLADLAVKDRLTLREHFRCQRAIIELCDAMCGYGLQVRTPPANMTGLVSELTHPLLLVDIEGQQHRSGGSWFNPREIDEVMAILGRLRRVGVPWQDVGIITPYVGQLLALRERVQSAGIPIERELDMERLSGESLRGVAMGTVHRFQGGERRLIIFTTVATQQRSLTFLNGRVNLTNVAVSRAREHLVVVGSRRILCEGPYTRFLVEQAHDMTKSDLL